MGGAFGATPLLPFAILLQRTIVRLFCGESIAQKITQKFQEGSNSRARIRVIERDGFRCCFNARASLTPMEGTHALTYLRLRRSSYKPPRLELG